MHRPIHFVGLFLSILALGNGNAYARGMVYADAHGTRIPLAQKSMHLFATPQTPSKILKSGNLTWNITYQDIVTNNNIGFDDPINGAARRGVAEAVLAYINQVLNVNSGATTDILFHVSETDGGDSLASAGSIWFDTPNRFDNGFAFEHITTGTDPDQDSVDVRCTVDFGFTWNLDYTAPAVAGQIDLFSVLLHEMTHGLGILSLSDNLGLGLNGANPDVYTQWDRLMRFGASTVCWNASTTFLEVGTNAFTSDNLFFSGAGATAAFGSRPPLYAPSPYEPGSSLAHFKTGSVNSIMQHSIGAGVARREYTAVDIAALRDIGYTNAAPLVVEAPVANFTASPVSGDAPLTVSFTDTSTNFPTAWAWDFNNDSVTDSTSRNPSHTYSIPGFYTVKLTVTNTAGSDLETKAAYITANVKTNIEVSGNSLHIEGDQLTLTATPAGALGYQWFRNGQPIQDATASILVFESATTADSGAYTCEITTATNGVVTTSPVQVVIYAEAGLPAAGILAIYALALLVIAVAAARMLRKRAV